MWIERHQAAQVKQQRRIKRYPSDVTDAQWQVIEPLLPRPACTARRRSTDLREVVNTIRYLGTFRLRMAHAAGALPALADGVLVVQALCATAAV